MSPLYEPQLLTAEFANGVPQIPTKKMRPLNQFQQRYIYWGFAGRIPQVEIARAIGCDKGTVWRRIKKVRLHPIELFHSGFVQGHGTRNGTYAFFCRYCGFGAKTDVTVIEHAYEHLFGVGSLQLAPAPSRAPSPWS